ncbi:MAG: maleylacetoacetate isomerase [Pseudomonadota bacterium]
MSEVVLHGFWRSGSAHRVRIALALKGVAYRDVSIDLGKRAQDAPAFRALNPAGQVPVLEIDGLVLTQSVAILAYLDASRPTPRLFPEDPIAAARVWEITEQINSSIQPLQLPGSARRDLLAHLGLSPSEAASGIEAYVRDHLATALDRLDRQVARTAGRFCVGDDVTAADVALIPQLDAAARAGIDVNAFPTLSPIYERCVALDAFREAAQAAPPDVDAMPSPTSAAVPVPGAAAAVAYKEPADLGFLLDRANRPIPGLQTARDGAFQQFGPIASKISGAEVCLFLRWLAENLGARNAIEVGVFTGSSSLALLDGMGPQGRLTAFDVSDVYVQVAQTAWHEAGFAERVELTIDDAAAGMGRLAADPKNLGAFDLVYIDGANWLYRAFYEAALPLLRVGGVIVFDNVLWKGRVARGDDHDPSAVHLRELLDALPTDARVTTTVLSLGDGLALCTKRASSEA